MRRHNTDCLLIVASAVAEGAEHVEGADGAVAVAAAVAAVDAAAVVAVAVFALPVAFGTRFVARETCWPLRPGSEPWGRPTSERPPSAASAESASSGGSR